MRTVHLKIHENYYFNIKLLLITTFLIFFSGCSTWSSSNQNHSMMTIDHYQGNSFDGPIKIHSNEQFFLSEDNDRKIKLWNIKTGELIKIFRGHTNWSVSIITNTNTKYILSGNEHNTIKLWEIEKGRLLKSFKKHTYVINSVLVTPSGKYILSAMRNNHVKLYRLSM